MDATTDESLSLQQALHDGNIVKLRSGRERALYFVDGVERVAGEYVAPDPCECRRGAPSIESRGTRFLVGHALDVKQVAIELAWVDRGWPASLGVGGKNLYHTDNI